MITAAKSKGLFCRIGFTVDAERYVQDERPGAKWPLMAEVDAVVTCGKEKIPYHGVMVIRNDGALFGKALPVDGRRKWRR